MVAGLLVLRSTTAPLHERVAFVGFVLVEMVLASGQFWDSVFGDGRDVHRRVPAGRDHAAGHSGAHGRRRTSGATKLWVLTTNRVVTNKRLAWLTAVAVAALIVVARRRILFQ